MKEEKWLPVVGYEGLYEVSNLGRVRSLDRVVDRGGHPFDLRGRTLKPQIRFGYAIVGLYTSEHSVLRLRIHRLVALAFLGSPPDPESVVNHRDFDKLNNTPANLEYCSNVDNLKYSHAAGRFTMAGGRSTRTGSPEVLSEVLRLLDENELGGGVIEAQLGLRKGLVTRVRTGRMAGTPRRKTATGLTCAGRRTKMTPEAILNVFNEYHAGGVTQRELAEKYGLSRSFVSAITLKNTWRDLFTSPP